MNEKHEYRCACTISTKVAVVALQEGWRAVYCDDGELNTDRGAYFMAVIHTEVFRRPIGSRPNVRWEPCPPGVPGHEKEEEWGVVEFDGELQTLVPLDETSNFVMMLPPGQEISDQDRADHQAQHHAGATHKTAPGDLPS